MVTILLIMKTLTIAAVLLSVIYTAGVVWRVEMKVDTSYKFFLAAILFFLSGEAFDLFSPLESGMMALGSGLSRLLFSLSFLAGIFSMRSAIRKMDGEMKE